MATDNESLVRIKIDGKTYSFDMDDLELGEVGTVEDLCGKSMVEIDWSSARGVQGLVWVARHREDPSFTVQDAGRIKFSALEEPEGDKPGPTEAPARKKRAASGDAS
jgi:hypothetical protein